MGDDSVEVSLSPQRWVAGAFIWYCLGPNILLPYLLVALMVKASRLLGGPVSINLPSIAIVDRVVFPDWRACLHPILLNDEVETSSLGGISRTIRVARARASELIVAI